MCISHNARIIKQIYHSLSALDIRKVQLKTRGWLREGMLGSEDPARNTALGAVGQKNERYCKGEGGGRSRDKGGKAEAWLLRVGGDGTSSDYAGLSNAPPLSPTRTFERDAFVFRVTYTHQPYARCVTFLALVRAPVSVFPEFSVTDLCKRINRA